MSDFGLNARCGIAGTVREKVSNNSPNPKQQMEPAGSIHVNCQPFAMHVQQCSVLLLWDKLQQAAHALGCCIAYIPGLDLQCSAV